MELIIITSISVIIVAVLIGLHLGFGAYLSHRLFTRDNEGNIPWLNLRNILITLVLVVMFTAHLMQSGIIGGL